MTLDSSGRELEIRFPFWRAVNLHVLSQGPFKTGSLTLERHSAQSLFSMEFANVLQLVVQVLKTVAVKSFMAWRLADSARSERGDMLETRTSFGTLTASEVQSINPRDST